MMNRAHHSHGADERGSMIVAAMAVIALTLLLVSTALTTAMMRYRTAHQSSRWAQASQAAEAGVELALITANANTWVTDGWSGVPGAVGSPPVTRAVTLGTGANEIAATIAVDRVMMGTEPWLRIRSAGLSALPGGRLAGIDPEDTRLRRLSLRFDRVTGLATSVARSTRQVEVLAGPRASRPFRHAFVSKQRFDIQPNASVDSYDSRDGTKSNLALFNDYGVYDPAKRQQNGDIATNDAQSVWNLNFAHIWGDVNTPTGSVSGQANVHGAVNSGFNMAIADETSPDWTTVTQNHGPIANTNVTIVAGTQNAPARHKFTSVTLTDPYRNIRIQNPPGETQSWAEIWVEGDALISGVAQAGIQIDPGVSCVIHFGGNVYIDGSNGSYGLSNGSQLASRLAVRAYGGGIGSIRSFILKNSDFWGAVSAPWYQVQFDVPGRQIHGSFVTWQFMLSDFAQIHYDEALANFALGQASGFEVRSWIEAVR